MSTQTENLTRLRDILRLVQNRLNAAHMALDDSRPDYVRLELERADEALEGLVHGLNQAIFKISDAEQSSS